ncbi:MAG: MFS transporter [Candidatus Hermodarchaeota archaeon]
MTTPTESGVFPKKKWLTQNILLLGLVSFFADLSGEMMVPVLPLFIVAVGGTALIVGFIGGLGDAVASILKVFSGYLADKIGRRKGLIFVGYGIPFFAKLGIGLSNSWEQVVILKPAERIGKGIRGAPRDSLLADSTTVEERGKAFGFHRMMDTAGAIFGSFGALTIVLLFFSILGSEIEVLRTIIIISAFISLLAVIPIVLLRDTGAEQPSPDTPPRVSLINNLRSLPGNYYKFLGVSTLFGLGNFTILLFILQVNNVVPLETVQQLVATIPLSLTSEQVTTAIPIALFIWFSIIYTILSIPFGSWSDKYGRKVIFAIGTALFAITCFGLAFTSGLLMLILFFAIYGAFNAATDGIQKAFVVDLVPNSLKGTAIGLLQTITGFAAILAGTIAGFLMALDTSYPFIYGGILAVLSTVLLFVLRFGSSSENISD